MTAKRIQLRRTKGWRKPAGAVVCTRPGRWGNPYKVGAPHPEHGFPMSAGEAVALFERRVENDEAFKEEIRRELRGKDLCCVCPLTAPCHVDVYLRVANEPAKENRKATVTT